MIDKDLTPDFLEEILSGIDKERNAASALDKLERKGGPAGIVEGLGSSILNGLSSEEDHSDRIKLYGRNVLPEPESKSFIQLFWDALQDTTLIILSSLATLSLVLKLTLGKGEERETGWIEPCAILFAVLIVALVTSINDWSKERQFRNLNKEKEDRVIRVRRDGETTVLSIYDLLVGDIVVLQSGDQLPGDGLFVQGHNVKTDNSPLNGETKEVTVNLEFPYLCCGCHVSEGDGLMVVTAVGVYTRWGAIMKDASGESPETPLQQKLDALARQISLIGIAVAALTFLVLVGNWAFRLSKMPNGFHDFDPAEDFAELVEFVMVAVTIIAVSVPEGLPLAVTISLAYSMKQMMRDNNLVRHLDACETMGGATNICSDKTGTLTENRMTVVKSLLCTELLDEDLTKPLKFFTGKNKFFQTLCEGIALNSTATCRFSDTGDRIDQGNKTECALLGLILLNDFDFRRTRREYEDQHLYLNLYSFSSDRKRMSTFVKSYLCEGKPRLYTKGASEVVLDLCSMEMLPNGSTRRLEQAARANYARVISEWASSGLRTLALAYRDFEEYSEEEFGTLESAPENELTLLGIVGIKDPVRKQVPDAMKLCRKAGVTVRMVTGDNLDTAKHIARECGIFDETKHTAMEGQEFREMSNEEIQKALQTLTVLARSKPQDKKLLVDNLHALGEVVAVTGDGTNDAPALKAADVGLSMGITGTEVAKEASDIIILDDNFDSIVKSVLWGRSVYENIRKFLQFQLTVNIVALSLTFISAVLQRESLPLTAIQLLWVNLIMDTFAALALATEPPNIELMNRKPYGRFDPLITSTMIRNIAGQSIFQLIVLLGLEIYGPTYFQLNPGVIGSTDIPNADLKFLNTIIFNTFVLMQLFNEFNARKVNNEANIFENIFHSSMFMFVILVSFLGQFLIVEFGGEATSTVSLSYRDWGFCIGLSVLCVPWAQLTRLVTLPERAAFVPENVKAAKEAAASPAD